MVLMFGSPYHLCRPRTTNHLQTVRRTRLPAAVRT